MINRLIYDTQPNVLTSTSTRFTAKNRDILSMKWRDDKEQAVKLINKKLPTECANDVYLRYVKKWNSHAYKGKYSALLWLRTEIAKLTSALQFFPVPLFRLKTIKQRKAQAKLCSDMCQSILVDCTSKINIGLFPTEQKMLDYANLWHFTPTPPTARLSQEEGEAEEAFLVRKKELLAMGRIERLRTDKWWESKIERAYRQFCEHCRIISGKTCLGVAKYVSKTARREFLSRQRANARYIDGMVARNTSTGEEIPLAAVIEGSNANKTIRRTEFMVRMSGFEDIADEHGLMGGFFTITAPSKYHASKTVRGKRETLSIANDKYQGFNPSQTQQYLCKTWSKVRAKLARLSLPYMGMRVAEPNHDATPHWHAIFFFDPKHEAEIVAVVEDYFTEEDRGELVNGITPRVEYKRMDKKKGTATGYIAKYISKNIDGYQLDDNEDGESAASEAISACAWASLWGIRQFQPIGGAPVGIWRELRKLPSTNIKSKKENNALDGKNDSDEKAVTPEIKSFSDLQQEKHPLELARYCADIGNWSMYLEAMGGIFCPRSLMPVSLLYKESENSYGEIVNKTYGVVCLGIEEITRADTWEIVKASATTKGSGVCKRQFVPWSSVNNCTRD